MPTRDQSLSRTFGKVTVFVPPYAMSGGTLIALTADEVVMDPNVALRPVDPQIGDLPAASIVKLLDTKPIAQISDDMLVLADVAAKARAQVATFVAEVLLKRLPPDKPRRLATVLSDGRFTHDFSSRLKAPASWGRRCRRTFPRCSLSSRVPTRKRLFRGRLSSSCRFHAPPLARCPRVTARIPPG